MTHDNEEKASCENQTRLTLIIGLSGKYIKAHCTAMQCIQKLKRRYGRYLKAQIEHLKGKMTQWN